MTSYHVGNSKFLATTLKSHSLPNDIGDLNIDEAL